MATELCPSQQSLCPYWDEQTICFLLFTWIFSLRRCLSLSAGINHRIVKCRQTESAYTNGLLVLSTNLLGSHGLRSAIISFFSTLCSSLKAGNPGFVAPLEQGCSLLLKEHNQQQLLEICSGIPKHSMSLVNTKDLVSPGYYYVPDN